ncbi:MAG: phosphate acetyltransferase [Cryobacterium sp.]|nr:phosphate acetyltransferase [Cryobacterium sp.]MBX3089946.1 phosphate acetyltransferase [Cryobacterium sp.]
MVRSIYVTSAEGGTGKSTIALGILETLARSAAKVGVFRPVARSNRERDYVLELMLAQIESGLEYDACVGVGYEDVHNDPEGALSRIVDRYHSMQAGLDAVVILGSDYTDVGSPTELSFNLKVAANLGSPVVLVLGGRQADPAFARTADAMSQLAEVATAELVQEHATLLAVIANRVDPGQPEEIKSALQKTVAGVPVWVVPEDPVLVAPTMRSVMQATDGALFRGDAELLDREALGVVVGAMGMNNILPRLIEGSVVVVPADRTEVLLAVLMANESGTFPSLAGIVLNGGFELPEPVVRLIDGLRSTLPIITTELGSYDTAVRITRIRPRLAADSQRKLDTARQLFEANVDAAELLGLLNIQQPTVLTPLMFEYGLIERARSDRKHIVLPEGDDDRILRAAATVLSRGIADLTILGEEIEVRSRAIGLGLDIQQAAVLSSFDDVLRLKFSEEYHRLREHKGVTLDRARDTVTDPSYFGTLMVHMGMADGMVSGAAHTTAHTVRPAFEIIKTKEGVSIVSSVFFMALADRVLVYGDCAVIPDPTAEQLADIAVSASETASQFGILPRIAMLSYSTGDSGSGAGVDKVKKATALVRNRLHGIPVDGPIQYDAAADAAVAKAKLPDSEVDGSATVFIFPDLNTGNNTYKAVQRSAGALAIGPVMQGLRLPVNDLSRGATVDDIVNTIAITAIQAQSVKR